MRKIVLNLATTLDGYIEGPNGELDWLVRDESLDFGDILKDILSDKDIIFYGRISYDKWGSYQPDANASQKIKDAYKLLHSKQKYVFSKTKRPMALTQFSFTQVLKNGYCKLKNKEERTSGFTEA
jgi:dihydrofolate reductase